MRHSEESNLIIKNLREYKFIFKTALALESEDLGVLFAEKTEVQKSRETVPIKFCFLKLLVQTYLKPVNVTSKDKTVNCFY
jgi:hypothetical protein